MSAQAAPRTGYKFIISVRAGPDQGATFQLLPPRVTIGRGSENNVALTDPKVSRNAAVIDFAMDKITITDVSSRASLSVNSEPLAEASIRNGDLIRIGSTEFQFIVEAIQLTPAPFPSATPGKGANAIATLRPTADIIDFPPAPMPGASKAQFGGAAYTGPASSRSRSSRSKEQNGKTTFYIVLGGAVAILVWLLNSSPVEKPVDPVLRTTEAVEQDITNSEERVAEIMSRRTFKSDEEKTRYEEAQVHYLAGFRDYQKGQWLRSLRAFETARAIDPGHELALRYMGLAEKQRDEMAATMTLEGRRYKEKNMYSRCSAALEKALEAMPNKNDVKFKEAESLKKECDLLAGDRFR